MGNVWTRDERLGQQTVTKEGHLITIVEYNQVNDIVVEFEDGTRKNATYGQFQRNNIIYPRPSRIGETVINNQGYEQTCINTFKSKLSHSLRCRHNWELFKHVSYKRV